MKRILITGGTGFFGKSILDYWSRAEKFGNFERSNLSFAILSRHGLAESFLSPIKPKFGYAKTSLAELVS